jgi:hypothetical protein
MKKERNFEEEYSDIPEKRIKDKSVFYTGLIMQLIQFGIIFIFVLSLLDWSWITPKRIIIFFCITAIIIYNIISIILIKLGLKR